MKNFRLKNFVTACLFLAPAFTFTSCEDLVLRGEGDMVTRTRTVASFDAVEAGGRFDIYLSQGPTQDIRLEGQENVLSELRTRVHNNKLEIDFDRNHIRDYKAVRIYLTTPNLRKLDLSGNNEVHGLTAWQVNDLDLHTSGSGEIDLNLVGADEVRSHSSGSSEIKLQGNARHLNVEISGSGKVAGFGMQTKTADVQVSGSGRCELTVSETLKTRISGSGKVRYRGDPQVHTAISGSGSVNRVE